MSLNPAEYDALVIKKLCRSITTLENRLVDFNEKLESTNVFYFF